MSNERSVTFSLSASDVNALDGTAKTLVTFPSNGLIRVPERLELHREAGTAYTLTKGEYPTLPPVPGDYFDSYTSGFESGNYLQVYEGTTGDSSPRVWFKVAAEGFLDVATEQQRIVFPQNSLKEFKGGVTSVLIEYRGYAIASGTGSVSGTLFFKEFGVTQPMGR